ncbi:hypothetical protein FHS18_001746 [Paenibacillus phyllosphaerae]|uniref:Transglutaminase-like domain-containing protein n=1 Tax=Paenibacillus phyllosphaerae TaxID=274593 RepID=A0A7W5AVR6_9BACL|nr:transglutaminase domain-containing protein [Paenibacillus phyllosphaerae]MBB3109683.1 hypothetical protein [Paenibacillus phyllosphaerae]
MTTKHPDVFSLDAEVMDVIERKFQEKRRLAHRRERQLFGIFQQEELTAEETWSLKFMFAYMPVNDLADYDGELFLSHVRQTLKIRKAMPWGERVPDDLFLHFVLPYRVNTENIEDARGILHAELAQRTSKLSMEDAILETNYWCHERATYIGSDLRTLSPLSMIRNARGRCGEESTLAVAALRSIGIPARQVYTPRWAHCDDNHAWVEAWADGQWYYFGACEPEARLNVGWFSPPARRAMLINTRISGNYGGPEDVTLADEWFTEINLLENYARTRTITVHVKDEQGNPVSGALVRFELYNMAEFYPIAALPANEQGEAVFKTGYGDLLIRAVHEGRWGECVCPASSGERVEIIIAESAQPAQSVDLELVPPPETEGSAAAPLSESAIERHNERLEEGTAIRSAYEATFMDEKQALELANRAGLPPQRVWEALQKARGNSREIAAFLEANTAAYGEWPLRLLESMNEKDLIDTWMETLNDHLVGALAHKDGLPEEIFTTSVLRPRVLYEKIVPYRQRFRSSFTEAEIEAFRSAPNELARRLEKQYAYWEDLPNLKGRGNPIGTYELMGGDETSLHILFVAVCRSLGIPARLHPSELKPQYWQHGIWEDATFDATGRAAEGNDRWGTIRMLPDPGTGAAPPAPSYAENFTVARLENGAYKTLLDPFGKHDVYAQSFEAEPGDYRLVSGIRLPDGAVLARLTYFTVNAGQTTDVPLTFRSAKTTLPVLGTVGLAEPLTLLDGTTADFGQLAGSRALIAAWLEPEREPTKHLLRELSELAEPLSEQGLPILLIIGDDERTSSFDPAQYPKLPANALFLRSRDGDALPPIFSQATASEAGFPHVVVLDAQRRIRYSASGYKIGTGKEALQACTQLEQNLGGDS